jgi:hypothetical protein
MAATDAQPDAVAMAESGAGQDEHACCRRPDQTEPAQPTDRSDDPPVPPRCEKCDQMIASDNHPATLPLAAQQTDTAAVHAAALGPAPFFLAEQAPPDTAQPPGLDRSAFHGETLRALSCLSTT